MCPFGLRRWCYQAKQIPRPVQHNMDCLSHQAVTGFDPTVEGVTLSHPFPSASINIFSSLAPLKSNSRTLLLYCRVRCGLSFLPSSIPPVPFFIELLCAAYPVLSWIALLFSNMHSPKIDYSFVLIVVLTRFPKQTPPGPQLCKSISDNGAVQHRSVTAVPHQCLWHQNPRHPQRRAAEQLHSCR